MEKATIIAFRKAAGDRNIEMRFNDCAVLHTKQDGAYTAFNDNTESIITLRSNDDVDTYIKNPMELYLSHYEDLNHMLITGGYDDIIEILASLKSSGLITSDDLTKYKDALHNNKSLQNRTFTTSVQNSTNASGRKLQVEEKTGYGNADRLPNNGEDKYDAKLNTDYKDPERVTFDSDGNKITQ